MQIIKTGAPRTMTSLEISEVVQSRHDDVRRSIERLADRGVISLPPAAEVKVERERRTETVKVYLIGQRDSYIIVAQLSPEFTAALVDRWQELEAKAAPAPAELSRLQILQLAMDAEQDKLKAEAERDEAIRTKALIGSKREATAMATASAAKREAYVLRDRLGECTRHATVTAVENATGRRYEWPPLRRWCADNGAAPVDVPDKRFGKVKAWPAAAWTICHGVDLAELFGVAT